MTIFEEYCGFCAKYRRQYGDKSVVFMEIGSFFELTGDEDSNGSDVRAISSLLNIVCTKKSKSVAGVSKSNPLLAGFPTAALQKYLPVLLENGYTVVMVTQTTPPPNPKRAVTRIYSPGTYVDDIRNSQSNNLMTAFVETTPAGIAYVGCAVMDLSTGACRAGEALSTSSDPHSALDELFRWLRVYCPVEFVLCGAKERCAFSYDDLMRRLELTHEGCCVHDYVTRGDFDTNLARLDYQEVMFNKAYPDPTAMLSAVERMGLERSDWARVAFAALLRFGFQHDETVINRLSPLGPLDCPDKLAVGYNTLSQLAVHSGRVGTALSRRGDAHAAAGPGTLLKVLNRCITHTGRRLFADRLLNPVCDETVLAGRYDNVARCLDDGPGRERVCAQLKTIAASCHDMERLCRRVSLRLVQPIEVLYIHDCLRVLHDLLTPPDSVAAIVLGDGMESIVRAVMTKIAGFVDLTKAATYPTHTKTFLVPGVDLALDALDAKTSEGMAALEALAHAFSGKVVDLDVVCTVKRFKDALTANVWEHPMRDIADKLGDIRGDDDQHLKTPTSARFRDNNCKVDHDILHRFGDVLSSSFAQLQEGVSAAFSAFLEDLWGAHSQDLQNIVAGLAELDVVAACAGNARIFGYCRPRLSGGTGRSWLKAEAIRHPVIERVQEDRQYVVNDVALGTPGSKGMLLYGLNAAGKSSLVKAIGLNVVMAQAGMFVAADAFELRPYTQMFTRISTGDDVVKGQSTFTIEMSELRNILSRCDSRSLVLGDELCAGTETQSALAIVTAGLSHIDSNDSSYAFATHLHELENVPDIKELQELKKWHLTVEMRPDGQLIYERKLQEGSGATLYGIEVCRALKLPTSFLKNAQRVRQHLLGIDHQFVSTKRSRYNNGVYLDLCTKCKTSAAQHTHHIVPQQFADDNGIIGRGNRMNARYNLMPLCRACHEQEHDL